MDAEGRISWTWSTPAAVEVKEVQTPSEPTTADIIVTFSLYGDSEHGAEQSHSMTEGTMTPWVTNKLYIMESGSTAWDVLQKAAKENGFTLHSRDSEYGVYIEGVTYGGISLYEFDNGSSNSGWMYRVNGTLPPVTVENYTMKNGDNLVFHFTDDYTKENETISMNGPSSTGSEAEETVPDTETEEPAEDNTEKIEKIKSGVENTRITVRTKKVSNGIKVTWTKSKGYKVDYYEVFRSTKRYSGYGKAAFYTTKNAENPDKTWYVNTKDLKAGTRYYYKVRGVRVLDGKKYYTQWSTKAWRVA